MTRNKFYILNLFLVFFSYFWLVFHSLINDHYHSGICIIKKATGFPCPSCGTTRAIDMILKGDLFESILTNPFGIIIFSAILVVPCWIIFDLITKKESYHQFYQNFNFRFHNKIFYIIFGIIVISNWIWNISKDL